MPTYPIAGRLLAAGLLVGGLIAGTPAPASEPPGSIVVTSTEGGKVRLDGRRQGRLAAFESVELQGVAPGLHTVQVGRASREVRVASGQVAQVAFDTGALPPPTAAPDPLRESDQHMVELEALERARSGASSPEYEQLAREKRREAIAFIQGAHVNLQGDQRAELMLRLADLYREEGADLRRTTEIAHEDTWIACLDTPGCDPSGIQLDLTASAQWTDRAIALYERILRETPMYPRGDEASFYLAIALAERGRSKESAEQLAQMVRTYPESQYVPDAYVHLGEHYFAENNAYKALLAYQKATRYRDSALYGFAMYKLAWCYYNVGEYQKANEIMSAVATTPDIDPRLQAEAAKDLLLMAQGFE